LRPELLHGDGGPRPDGRVPLPADLPARRGAERKTGAVTPEETTVPRRAAIIPAALLFAAASLPADAPPDGKPADDAPPKNLVANGDFEDGDDTPKGWQTVDGLSSFYATDADPKHGKVLKIDTDVYQS